MITKKTFHHENVFGHSVEMLSCANMDITQNILKFCIITNNIQISQNTTLKLGRIERFDYALIFLRSA